MTSTSDEKRKTGRARARISVELLQPGQSPLFAETTDFSEIGTFLMPAPELAHLQPGTHLQIRITGLMDQGPRTLSATVVRADHQGIGLQFSEPL